MPRRPDQDSIKHVKSFQVALTLSRVEEVTVTTNKVMTVTIDENAMTPFHCICKGTCPRGIQPRDKVDVTMTVKSGSRVRDS